MKKKKTLKDIAEMLGVSTATVSRVFNEKPGVSELTRYKVKKIIKIFDYKPYTLARNLRQHKSGIIGVIVPHVAHYFFSTAFSGMLEVANKKGYSIMLYESQHNFEKEQKYIDKLIAYNVDGILISLSDTTTSFEHLKNVETYEIPLVIFDNISTEFEATKVVVDDEYGAYSAVEYLIRNGRKRIAHIAGTKVAVIAKRRLKGYLNALKKHRLKIDPALILECREVTEKEGYVFTKKLLSLQPLDAIFAVTDEVAVGVIKALKESDFRIPEDIAVIGFSNSIVSTVITPELTTVEQPSKKMGATATEILINKIERKQSENFSEILKTHLIVRGSA